MNPPDILTQASLKDQALKQGTTIHKMLEDIHKVIAVLQPLAGNRRFMQLAGPARQVLNILKAYEN